MRRWIYFTVLCCAVSGAVGGVIGFFLVKGMMSNG